MNQQRLHELFDYADGVLLRRRNPGKGNWRTGPAGTKTPEGYIEVRVDGALVLAHRVVWVWHHGAPAPAMLDHINGVRDDNRIENLRAATREMNGKNAYMHSTNTSGIAGVHYEKGPKLWKSRVSINGARVTVYHGKDFFEACCARKSAENRHGYSPRHGNKR